MKSEGFQPEGFKKTGQNNYLGAVNTAIQAVTVVAFLIPPAAMRKRHSFKPARLSNSNHYRKKQALNSVTETINI